jgi:hypothetical protein|nr:MAG TPA: hypothetical protein [Microviridae sp.]
MDKKFRNQLLAESKKREAEVESVNLEIEERVVSENGPFVLIRNKKNKWVITTCGALINGKEFDTKEDAEKHLTEKHWEDILTAALIFFTHVKDQMENTKKE